MTVAITGGTGFLGLRLLPLLLARGEPVVVLAHAGGTPAMHRIAGFLPDTDRCGLSVLNIDVTRPHLGLPRWQFRTLAGRLTELWHCAGSIDLDGSAEVLHRTNVLGTQRVLELADAGSAMLYHVSTAFVAGRRRTGCIAEGDLDDSHGFENSYEESKYHGEVAVNRWSVRRGRPAVIFRPSILVTDTAPAAGPHPLLALATMVDYLHLAFAPRARDVTQVQMRISGHPQGHLNLIPVELAARLMTAMARQPPAGVRTVHVTYPHEVAVNTLFAVFERRFNVRLELLPSALERPTMLESLIATRLRGFLPYLHHRRRYDRAQLAAGGLDPVNVPPLEPDYLSSGLTRQSGGDSHR